MEQGPKDDALPGATTTNATMSGAEIVDVCRKHTILEKTAYTTARGVADEVKVLNLNGTDVSTIRLAPRPGIADRPDSFARKGSNLYVTVRYSGQVARIKRPDR